MAFRKRTEKTRAVRVSVSFPEPLYTTMAQLADQKKVSVAWIVRDAAEKYVADQWPLLAVDLKPEIK
jgi:metal-responsive CopG/Arc/MetJ family transcriptional regulator